MPRRVTRSQLNNLVRQQQQKRRQAIHKFNQAVNDYNRQVRTHNARVHRNRQELKTALARLQRTSSNTYTTYVVYRTSTYNLDAAYDRINLQYQSHDQNPDHNYLMDLATQENENSIAAANAVIAGEFENEEAESIQETEIDDELISISSDLNDRWHGALYALNPHNPDAARHFCTSSRELIIKLLDFGAPDEAVIAHKPQCEKTESGMPIRREKVQYLVDKKGLFGTSFGDFVDEDINNVTQLFRIFNDGTHGTSGTFDLRTLVIMKRRVEGAILFLTELMS